MRYVYVVNIPDANSVNMAVKKRAYHHGDLRGALLREGLRILETRPVEGLGLREVARAAEVSATAVYRHFPDKGALLRALSSEGFERLGDAQEAASKAAGGGARGLTASGVAYVRFALKNPSLFRLMFSHAPSSDSNEASEKDAAAVRAMRMLQESAAAILQAEVGSEDARTLALRAWCLVHGLSQLMLDGQVDADDRLIKDAIDIEALIPSKVHKARKTQARRARRS
jgi:AcrR family transcriptional regulator